MDHAAPLRVNAEQTAVRPRRGSAVSCVRFTGREAKGWQPRGCRGPPSPTADRPAAGESRESAASGGGGGNLPETGAAWRERWKQCTQRGGRREELEMITVRDEGGGGGGSVAQGLRTGEAVGTGADASLASAQ